MKTEQRKIADLIPFARNSRTHSDEQVAQIAASIREFGWTNPILVDDANGIIAGHGRLAAARKLGMAEVPVIVLDHLTDAQKRALVIADNKLALNAGWDLELLSSEIEGLGEDGFDLSLLGFNEDELAALLVEKTEGLVDPDDIPEVPADPVSVLGDVWLLGKHRIVCGDSTDADNLTKLMNGERADMLFTSPPYAQQRDYGAAKEKVSDWDALMQGVFSIAPVKDGAQLLVNLGLVHREGEWMPYWDGWIAWMREAGWRRFGWYVWDQGPGLPGDWNGRLAPSHEFIFHFNRETLRANKSVASKMAGVVSNGGLREKDGSIGGRSKGPSAIQSHKIHDSVFRVMRHKGGLGKAGKHPAVFPVALVEEAFDAYTKAGDIVFEPFCGSGTQVIAAEKLGRHCFGSELDPAYVDVAVKRWQEFTGLDAVHEETGKTFAEMAANLPTQPDTAREQVEDVS